MAAISNEYASQTIGLGKQHWYTVSCSGQMRQIDNYGKAKEHELPPDKGAGYVWLLYSIERFEERGGGVLTPGDTVFMCARADSTEPTLFGGYVIVVDQRRIGKKKLNGKMIVAHRAKFGLVVARFWRLKNAKTFVSDNRSCDRIPRS
jgi:hypothetical protein